MKSLYVTYDVHILHPNGLGKTHLDNISVGPSFDLDIDPVTPGYCTSVVSSEASLAHLFLHYCIRTFTETILDMAVHIDRNIVQE